MHITVVAVSEEEVPYHAKFSNNHKLVKKLNQ